MREAEEGAARKAFDLALPALGPYALDFTRNGRFLLLGGRRGHLALLDWQSAKLLCEVQVRRGVGRHRVSAWTGCGLARALADTLLGRRRAKLLGGVPGARSAAVRAPLVGTLGMCFRRKFEASDTWAEQGPLTIYLAAWLQSASALSCCCWVQGLASL